MPAQRLVQARRPVVIFLRVDQISERTMARKHRFRFGLRDVLAGRRRIAQGQCATGEFGLPPSAEIDAANQMIFG